MNILLTSVGRRNYLVDYFKDAVNPYGGLVHACNSDPNAGGLYAADRWVISPLIYDKNYTDFLVEYCKNNSISLIISLFDIDLPVLSAAKKIFSNDGIRVLAADEWVNRMANDKWETQAFLKKNGFNTVSSCINLNDFFETHQSGKIDFPVFVKPRWGMGSLSVYRAKDMKELLFYFSKVKEEISISYLKFESMIDIDNTVLIQSQLPGHEYGLDVINDLDGNYCTTIVKKKIAMRSGETDIAETVNEPLLLQLGQQIASLTRHPANMDMDVFFDGENPYILELNPRFGGGYPFSHAAGANLPLAIVKWARGESFDFTHLLSVSFSIRSFKGITIIKQ